MKAFGENWADESLERIPTPVGSKCLYCDEEICEGDQGVTLPFMDVTGVTEAAQHRECMIRSVVGSVGHQKKTCHCYGGTEEDPVGMTKREAAKAAVLYAQITNAETLH